MRIAIVAGESSGDLLGAGLMAALRKRLPEATFYGIAGPQMEAAGCEAVHPMERLSVMGLIEVLGRLPELLSLRRKFGQQLLADPPDLFIGIDAPDFNLPLEERLHSAGIKTVHYVSPSVWAWRRSRIPLIKRSIDLVLTLFPFENQVLEDAGIKTAFVGHPLADHIPLEPDKNAAREQLELAPEAEVVALLPGSRKAEIKYLGRTLIETVELCRKQRPQLQFLVPLANAKRRQQFEEQLRSFKNPPVLRLLDGDSHLAMCAADVVLLASGTATLEAMLFKRPMVVAYRLARLSYHWIMGKLDIKRYSLPNLLADEDLVPELIQDDATPINLSQAVLELIEQPEKRAELAARFTELHQQLARDANRRAAEAVVELLDLPRSEPA